jgi:hypothetical protein
MENNVFWSGCDAPIFQIKSVLISDMLIQKRALPKEDSLYQNQDQK